MTITFAEFMEDAPEPTAALRRAFQRRKELTTPRHLNARVFQSEFRPGVCCEHEWETRGEQDTCLRCGATCVRDREGKITTYTAGETT